MEQGVIIRALSGFYDVDAAGDEVRCRARGKFRRGQMSPLVGDKVRFQRTGDEGVIDEILPRRNSFVRPPVANLDQLIIFASGANPVTDPFLIDRIAAIAENAACEPVICINKADLHPGDALYDLYRKCGYQTVRTSTVTGEGVNELRSLMAGKISALTGNSGVGKSSVLNALDPSFSIPTGEVSAKLGRGRHTTRHVELYRLACGALAVDTPGFSSFDTGLGELADERKLAGVFREFAPYLDGCRFSDCSHMKELGCAVLDAVHAGEIPESRHASYMRLYEQAQKIKAWEIK